MRQIFLSNVYNPSGVAVNPQSGKIYYSDRAYETINEVDSQGQNQRVLKRNLRNVGVLRTFRDRHTSGVSLLQSKIFLFGDWQMWCFNL